MDVLFWGITSPSAATAMISAAGVGSGRDAAAAPAVPAAHPPAVPRPEAEAAAPARRRRERPEGSEEPLDADTLLHFEEPADPSRQRRDAVVAKTQDDTVGREDVQRAGHRLQGQHQDRLAPQGGRVRRSDPPLVAVAERGLIAVVSVGDRERRRGRDPAQLVRGRAVTGGGPPEPVAGPL